VKLRFLVLYHFAALFIRIKLQYTNSGKLEESPGFFHPFAVLLKRVENGTTGPVWIYGKSFRVTM
jgi:hypothetical protein